MGRLDLQLYVLTDGVARRDVQQPSPINKGHRVHVHDDDWVGARAKAAKHAMDMGYYSIAIWCHTAELYHRPHWNGNGTPAKTFSCEQRHQHDLWNWLERLAESGWATHAYVPPLAWARSRKAWGVFLPVIPSVAAYRVSALHDLPDLETNSWGAQLCAAGHGAFTLSDFFHNCNDNHTLEESGTHTTWRKSYERALAHHL